MIFRVRYLIVVSLEIIRIEEFRNDAAQIVGWKIGRLCGTKIQFGEALLHPSWTRAPVVNEGQAAASEKTRYETAAAVREMLGVTHHHPGKLFESALRKFH